MVDRGGVESAASPGLARSPGWRGFGRRALRAFVGTRSGFGGRRLVADMSELRDGSFDRASGAKMTTSMPPFLKKLGIEKPCDQRKVLKLIKAL